LWARKEPLYPEEVAMTPSQQLARLLPHASLLDVQDALMRQIREHPWSGDDATLTYRLCACPRCDSLETLRHAVLDWIERDLWMNH
jgi:hypothetical protein